MAKSTSNSKNLNPVKTVLEGDMPQTEHPMWKTVFYALLPIMCIVMLIASFWYGLSGDEAYANGMGKAAMKFIGSFGADESIFNQPDSVNRDGVLTYYGNIFDILALLLAKILPWSEYTSRHIFNAFVGFIGIYYSGKLVKTYWSFKPAVFTILIMFFFPFYMGHAMNNPKDVPMASFFIMGLYYIFAFYRNYNALKWHHYVLAIVSIVLAIDVRVAGLLLIVFMPLVALVHWPEVRSSIAARGILKAALPSILVAVCAYFACALFWPFAARAPLTAPLEALSFLSDFKIELGQIWEGTKVPSGELPGNYLIRSIIITSPYVFLFGLPLFAIGVLMNWSSAQYKWAGLMILFAGLFPLIYIMQRGSNVYHLWRHVLFVFPPMAICSALGWYWLGSIAKHKMMPVVASVIFGVLLLQPAIFTAKTFPNNVNYYNSMVGGTEGAYGQYEMDFYYNSMKPCVDKLVKEIYPTVKDSVLVASNGAHLLNQYLADKYPKFKTTYVRFPEKNTKDWDYAIFHISLVPLEEIQAGSWAGYNGPILTSAIEGKPLCVLLKRPSKDDLKMVQFLDQKNYPEAYNACMAYLQKDPTNPSMLDLSKRLSGALQQAAGGSN
jgi:hypothetical protein